MNLLATDAERRFADEVRDFIVSHLPSEVAHKVAHDQHLSKDDVQGWQSPLAAKGWLAYTLAARTRRHRLDAAPAVHLRNPVERTRLSRRSTRWACAWSAR